MKPEQSKPNVEVPPQKYGKPRNRLLNSITARMSSGFRPRVTSVRKPDFEPAAGRFLFMNDFEVGFEWHGVHGLVFGDVRLPVEVRE